MHDAILPRNPLPFGWFWPPTAAAFEFRRWVLDVRCFGRNGTHRTGWFPAPVFAARSFKPALTGVNRFFAGLAPAKPISNRTKPSRWQVDERKAAELRRRKGKWGLRSSPACHLAKRKKAFQSVPTGRAVRLRLPRSHKVPRSESGMVTVRASLLVAIRSGLDFRPRRQLTLLPSDNGPLQSFILPLSHAPSNRGYCTVGSLGTVG